MKIAIKTMLLAALAAGGSAAAQAETGFYAGAGYTHFDGDDVALGGLTGRLGVRLHPNFAIEGEASFGVNDDEVGPLKVELDHAVAAYGVGVLPVSPTIDLFARAGFASLEADGAFGVARQADGDGFAFGVGGQIMLTDRFGVRGDYTRIDGDEVEQNAFGVSGVVRF
jgi:hypothetical protein